MATTQAQFEKNRGIFFYKYLLHIYLQNIRNPVSYNGTHTMTSNNTFIQFNNFSFYETFYNF